MLRWNQKRTFIALAPLLCTWLWFATAQAAPSTKAAVLPKGVEKLAAVEGIEEFRLSNGLRVLLFADPSMETTTVNITYLVGSIHENYGETGLAHIVEHMMFKTTTKRTDITEELSKHGSHSNGTTWYDRTNYIETFTHSDKNLDWALDLEADRMVNLRIVPAQLAKELTVVRNEFEMGENYPKHILQERILSTAFLWHNYGNSTIGARSDIEGTTPKMVEDFYRTWYRPDNAVLVVAGKLDPKKTLDLVVHKFGSIPRPSSPLPKMHTTEPAQDGERTVTLRRVGDAQAVAMAYHIPSTAHPDTAALSLLSFILGDSSAGRLYKALVERKKAVSVSAYPYMLQEPGIFYVHANVRKGKSLPEVRRIMEKVITRLSTRPPTPKEVERARQHKLKDWQKMFRDSRWTTFALTSWISRGDWRLMFIHRDRLKTVTTQDVRRVANTYFSRNNRTVGMFIPVQEPERVAMPQAPAIPDLVKNYQGGASLAAAQGFDATPRALDQALIQKVLPSGMKVAVLPKPTRGQTVHFSLELELGTESSLKGKAAISQLTGKMLDRGTTKRTRQQIKDELARLKASLSVSGARNKVWVFGDATKDTLEAVLNLMADMLKNPAMKASELELVRQKTLAAAEEAARDPFNLAQTALMRHLTSYQPDDVRYPATTEEKLAALKKVTLKQVKRFHRNFYGVKAAELVLVGELEAGEVITTANKLFGRWVNKRPYQRLSDTFKATAAINQSIETPDKESAVFMASLTLPFNDSDPDYPALVLANYMTGGGFLSSRLGTRIRKKEGLSYGVGSFFRADEQDKMALFGAYAIYAPQNDGKLQQAFKEEINRIIDKGFTAEEIKDAKQGWLEQRKLSRSQNKRLTDKIINLIHNGRSFTWEDTLETKVQSLTAKDIQNAFKKHIRLEDISIVRAGDFEKVKTSGNTGPS